MIIVISESQELLFCQNKKHLQKGYRPRQAHNMLGNPRKPTAAALKTLAAATKSSPSSNMPHHLHCENLASQRIHTHNLYK